MESVKWEKPRAEVQAFVADDYVAACYSLICQYDSGRLSHADNWGNDNRIVEFSNRHSYEVIYETVRADDEPTINTNAYIGLKGKTWIPVFYWTSDGKYHASTGYVRDKANIS